MSVAVVHDHRGEFMGLIPRDDVWMYAKPNYTYTYDNIEGPLDEMEHSCFKGDIVFGTIRGTEFIDYGEVLSTHNVRMTRTMAKYYKKYPDSEVKPEFYKVIPTLEKSVLETWFLTKYGSLELTASDRPERRLIKLDRICQAYKGFVNTHGLVDNLCDLESRFLVMCPDRITKLGDQLYLDLA